MEIFESVDGPKPDHGLLKRLKRLDPTLKLTFSHYVVNTQTGRLVITEDGEPILHPCQHLWKKLNDGSWYHMGEFPLEQGGFGHGNATLLEIDKHISAAKSGSEIARMLIMRRAAEETLAERNHKDWRMDRTLANKKRIADLVFEGKSGMRQAKISSYNGQTNRSTPGEVLSDAKEDGWEL